MSRKAFDKIATGLREATAIARRRFGRDHEKPCCNPNVLTCALWECQKNDRCRLSEKERTP